MVNEADGDVGNDFGGAAFYVRSVSFVVGGRLIADGADEEGFF